MARWMRGNVQTIVVAMVTAAVTAGGPVMAAKAVRFARNADKVDGKHAVGAKASKAKRRGKLVATSPKTGFLPNNIIKKARNANLLDGLDSTAFAAASHGHDAAEIVSGLLDPDRIPSEIARDSEIFPTVTDNDGTGSGLDADLLDGKSADEFLAPTQDGMILWSSDASDWKAGMGAEDLVLGPSTGQTLVQPQTSTGNAQLYLTPDVPVALYGKQLSVSAVELCYDAASAHQLLNVNYERVTNANGTPATNTQVLDTVDHSDDACRLYSVPTGAITSEAGFGLQVNTGWTSGTSNLVLGRVTWVLAPTGTDATPLS